MQQGEVKQAMVVAEDMAGRDKVLVAYITLGIEQTKEGREGACRVGIVQDPILQQQTALLLRDRLQSQLPDYMVPGEYIVVDHLPLAQSGKIDRGQLACWRATSKDILQKSLTVIAPRSELEQSMCVIWCEVLGREKIGIYDNFFELGGHSLMATQMIVRVRKAFEVDISLRQLFTTPTIAEMSEVIEERLLARVEALSEAEARDLLT